MLLCEKGQSFSGASFNFDPDSAEVGIEIRDTESILSIVIGVEQGGKSETSSTSKKIEVRLKYD